MVGKFFLINYLQLIFLKRRAMIIFSANDKYMLLLHFVKDIKMRRSTSCSLEVNFRTAKR